LVATNRLLEGGYGVARTLAPLEVDETRLPAGALVVESGGDLETKLGEMSRELGIEVTALSSRPRVDTFNLRPLRVGVYKSWVTEWVGNYTAAEGWTRWVLDQYEFPYETLHNRDVRSEDLRSRYDVIVIPNQKAEDIVGGYRPGRRQFGIVHQALPPPEYQGGIENDGVLALGKFVKGGGTLLLIDQACDLVTDRMGIPVRSKLRDLPNEQFFGPGSIVRILVDPSHPVGHGMPEAGAAYFRKSRAFEFDEPTVKSVVRYGDTEVLMSGWILGEEHLAGKHAVVEVPLDKGRIILFGFPPYFRGQPHGTFKLFFNALFYGSAMANDS
jgi:hypothetical protein